ncbi:MAG: sulfatase [Armatimonadetes bacterium]|nr:sulfatase [Armatimonadota bacterium]
MGTRSHRTESGVPVALRLTTKLLVLLGCLFLGTAASSGSRPGARPNLLWLVAEDFGPELSCYGYPGVRTPNLDRLAAEGMRYTRFYTTAPVCSPSRSAFMTGMYQTTIGAHHHRSHRSDGYRLPAGVRLLPKRLQEAGYFTANLRELPPAFGFRGAGKTDWNFSHGPRPFQGERWSELAARQPFFAQLNFQETHRVFRAPRQTDPASVKLPSYYPDHPVARADWAAYLDSAMELDRKVGLVLRQLAADGLADNTVVLFSGDNGQAHVRAKQFCYEEGLHVPFLLRWPAGLPPPRHYRAGRVEERLVEAIDVAPTLLAFAGVPKPAGMQGRVLLGDTSEAPRRYAFGARDRCDETIFRFRTVRDDRYRYIRNFTPERPFLQPNAYKARQYPVWNLLKQLEAEGRLTPDQKALTAPSMPPEELYDLQEDPDQVRNLTASPKRRHREALVHLRRVLERWMAETDDQGRFPEATAAVSP